MRPTEFQKQLQVLREDGIESNRHSISCNICKFLPRHAYYTSPSDVPKHFSSLVPYEPVDRSMDRTCPECGSYYAFSYSQEWQSPSEGFGIDYEIHLDRLTPPEMRKRLQGEVLEKYLQTYDQQLARCRSNLSSPEQYLREDAARALVQHSIDQLDWPDCAKLLADQDAAVRQTALETLHEEWRKDQPQKRITPLVDTLVKLLDDPVPVACSQAAEMLATHYALQQDVANLLALLDRDHPFIKAEAINAVRSHSDLDPFPFLPSAKLLLRHDSGRVRYSAAQFLLGLAKKGVDSAAIIHTFAQLLSSKNRDLRKEAADALRELNWTESTDAAVVLDELIVTLSVEYARLFAYETLQKAARRGFNIARAFPRLLEVVGDTTDHSPYRAKALHTIKLGLSAALREKEDIDAVTDLLARLLSDPAEGIRRGATECFEPLIQHGGDLSRALPAIMTMLTKSHVSYIEVDFAEHVAFYLLSHREWPALDRLLAADKEVSGMASRALGKAASRGKDISPVVESLLQCLSTSSCYSRDGAAYALAELAFRHPSSAAMIKQRLRKITLDPKSAEMKRLARAAE